MNVRRKFFKILSLKQVPPAVQQCFFAARIEQLQALHIFRIAAHQKRVILNLCGEKQLSVLFFARRQHINIAAFDPAVSDAARIGRRLDLLGVPVGAANA